MLIVLGSLKHEGLASAHQHSQTSYYAAGRTEWLVTVHQHSQIIMLQVDDVSRIESLNPTDNHDDGVGGRIEC